MIWIGHAKCQPRARRLLCFLVITGGHTSFEVQYEWITCLTVAVHLDDQVVPVGSLIFEETPGANRISLDLGDAGITSKLNKAVDIVRKAAGKISGPWQTLQSDFGITKTCSVCAQSAC